MNDNPEYLTFIGNDKQWMFEYIAENKSAWFSNSSFEGGIVRTPTCASSANELFIQQFPGPSLRAVASPPFTVYSHNIHISASPDQFWVLISIHRP